MDEPTRQLHRLLMQAEALLSEAASLAERNFTISAATETLVNIGYDAVNAATYQLVKDAGAP